MYIGSYLLNRCSPYMPGANAMLFPSGALIDIQPWLLPYVTTNLK